MKEKRSKIIFFISVASAVIALIATILLADEFGVMPQRLQTTVKNELMEVHSDRAKAIIDSTNKRLIFLDSQNRIVSTRVSLSYFSKPKYYSALAMGEDSVYVAEYSYYPDGCYIDQETISRFTLDGKYLGKVLTIRHSMGEDRTLLPEISSLTLLDGKGYATGRTTIDDKIHLRSFPLNVPKKLERNTPFYIFDIPKINKCFVSVSFAPSKSEYLWIRTHHNEFYNLNWTSLKTGAAPKLLGPIKGTEGKYGVVIDFDAKNNPSVITQWPSEGKIYKTSFLYGLKQVSFWTAVLYLAIFIIVYGYVCLRLIFARKEYGLLKRLGFITLALAFSCFIISFYSMKLIEISNYGAKHSMYEAVTLMERLRPNPIGHCLMEYKDKNSITYATEAKVEEILEKATLDMCKLGYGMSFSLVAPNQTGEIVGLYSAAGDTLIGAPVTRLTSIIQRSVEKNGVEIENIGGTWKQAYVAACPFFTYDGKFLGAVIAHADSNIYYIYVVKECGKILIFLLTLLILMVFLIMEGINCTHSFLDYHARIVKKLPHPEFCLSRPFCFLLIAAGNLNIGLNIIIVKEMCTNLSPGQASFLMASALTVSTIGFLVGTPLSKLLYVKLAAKKMVALCGIGMACGYVLAYQGCLTNNLIFYLLGIFLINVAKQIGYLYCDVLAFLADDQNARTKFNYARATSKLAASSFSLFVAGIIASSYGNTSIEIFGICLSLLLIIFIYFFVPNDEAKVVIEKQSAKKGADLLETAKRIFSDRQAIALCLFIIIPNALIRVYDKFIFPIYAMEAGLDKSSISNLLVFCNATVFFCSPFMVKLAKEYGSRGVIITCCTILSGTFMMFMVEDSIVWATVTLLVFAIVTSVMEPSITAFWQDCSIRSRAEADDSSVVYTAIRRINSSARSMAFCSILNVLGKAISCFAIGAILLAGLLSFAKITKKSEQP